jgi:hypothetical protein
MQLNRAVIRIIRFVGNQRGLVETQETVEFLEFVILRVELRLQRREKKKQVRRTRNRGVISLFKHKQFRKYIHKKLSVRHMPPERQLIFYSNEETLEELCNLLKTVRSSADRSSKVQ